MYIMILQMCIIYKGIITQRAWEVMISFSMHCNINNKQRMKKIMNSLYIIITNKD